MAKKQNKSLMPSTSSYCICIMDILPIEIITKILNPLPPKTLCICKCVSKVWKLEIEKNDFRRKNLEEMKKQKLRWFITGAEPGGSSLRYAKTTYSNPSNNRINERR